MFLWDNFKIIHRDIKPENIFITDDNFVILNDFSLALQITEDFEGKENVGNPSYKAPEYDRDEKI